MTRTAANWKIKRTLEQRGLKEKDIQRFFQMFRALQGRGTNPGVKFQTLYDGENGGVSYIMWQDLRREGYIR